MNSLESGFLLLTSQLGNPERKPLTVSQFRALASRMRETVAPEHDRELTENDLLSLGYSGEMATRIVKLLSEQQLLEYYLSKGRRHHCTPLTRAGEGYPLSVRKRLGDDSPGSLWTKGDISLLATPMLSLVGSRDLCAENKAFAVEVGRQAAIQGYTLVSGNARGADKAAQESCLAAGGRVISIVADSLAAQKERHNVLYVSEEDFEAEFSAQRALSRNRCIHALGRMVFVAQSSLLHIGGVVAARAGLICIPTDLGTGSSLSLMLHFVVTQSCSRFCIRILHILFSSNCIHLTPDGLPFSIPGIGDVIDGAMQQAPHLLLHSISDTP